jgi:hypothetical protein
MGNQQANAGVPMCTEAMLCQENKLALAAWADRHTACVGRQLEAVWPELAVVLREAVSALPLRRLVLGPGKSFANQSVDPAVEAWVQRRVRPLLEAAIADAPVCACLQPGQLGGAAPAAGEPGSVLSVGDVLGGLCLPAGAVVGGGAAWLAVTTVTQFLVFTTLAVNWWLLCVGLAVAAVAAAIGGHSVIDLRRRLRERFEKRLLPRLREALIGAGIEHKGQRVPSLRAQLQAAIRQAARQARQKLDEQGAAA